MFLKKHKGEDIVVPSPEEIAKQEAKALEATLEFLHAPVKAESQVSDQEEKDSPEKPSEDTSKEENNESAEKENFSEGISDGIEEKKPVTEDANDSVVAPVAEDSIDRTKYPAYKPISDDIKRGGRFRKIPSKVTAPPLQVKTIPEAPEEKEPVKEIENEIVNVPEIAQETPSSTPLKNPLPTPAKHIKKEIDFDYAVDEKDMHFDIDLTITNMNFDIN